MRTDIANEIQMYKKDKKIMNKSELARRLNCNRRTIDKYINEPNNIERKKRNIPTKLEKFTSIILDKVDSYGATAKAVYKFIQNKGYTGSYNTVNNFVKEHKNNEVKKATIRFETTPGLQAQVDWKEKITMINRYEEIFEINIFLIVLGYSRLKYIKLTNNKTQKTLFECMFKAFQYFLGIPKEILFDNMATVVDREFSTFKNVVINETFKCFAKDAGFEPITCRPYRAQTKGKVETVAKLMDRLKVYNREFETFEDLDKIVENFNDEINNEISQATNQKPIDRFQNEKEHLNLLPSMDCILSYFHEEKQYKVSRESMIRYKGKKYSVSTRFLGNYVSVIETEQEIKIYYEQDLIVVHKKSEKFLHYKHDHAVEILKSDALKYRSEKEIDNFIENNLKTMDIFLE